MIFAAIAGWAEDDEFPIDFMCTELQVSRSGTTRGGTGRSATGR